MRGEGSARRDTRKGNPRLTLWARLPSFVRPPVDRGSPRRIRSCGSQPAYISLIRRRSFPERTLPSLAENPRKEKQMKKTSRQASALAAVALRPAARFGGSGDLSGARTRCVTLGSHGDVAMVGTRVRRG